MTYLAILPSIYRPWTNACLRSCRLDGVELVDNTRRNRGVAASWNLGVHHVRGEKLDWLIIMSAACRFGDAGGADFIEHLEATDGAEIAVEADNGVGWHLIAFPRFVLEKVGFFDENFHPAYYEDNDYAYRMRLEFGQSAPWPKVGVDVRLEGLQHGRDLANVQVDFATLRSYYVRKWGGMPSHEHFTKPFNGRRVR